VGFVQIRNDESLSACIFVKLEEDLLHGGITVHEDESERLEVRWENKSNQVTRTPAGGRGEQDEDAERTRTNLW
jgi:hypothetical protein